MLVIFEFEVIFEILFSDVILVILCDGIPLVVILRGGVELVKIVMLVRFIELKFVVFAITITTGISTQDSFIN